MLARGGAAGISGPFANGKPSDFSGCTYLIPSPSADLGTSVSYSPPLISLIAQQTSLRVDLFAIVALSLSTTTRRTLFVKLAMRAGYLFHWDSAKVRAFFESRGLALQEWDKFEPIPLGLRDSRISIADGQLSNVKNSIPGTD